MTRKLNDDFKVETEEVVADITTQLNQFENFDEQQKRIEDLASRVQAGRQRIKTLGSRVDLVQNRVTGWELSEKEWKDKTRKRLRIMWTVMFVFLFIFVGMMIFQYSPAKTQGPSPFKGLNTSGLLGKVPDINLLENETWTLKRKTEDRLEKLRNAGQGRLEEDPRLRIFDELWFKQKWVTRTGKEPCSPRTMVMGMTRRKGSGRSKAEALEKTPAMSQVGQEYYL